MSRARGQVWRFLHHCGRGLLLLGLLGAIGLGLVAWRLAEAPLVAPWLAARIVAAAEARIAPAQLEIGSATIGWGGWRGAAAPFEVRLWDVQLRDGAGVLRASLPEADVALSLPALLRGRIAPAAIELAQPLLVLRRGADGGFGLDTATPDAPETPAAEVSEAASVLTALLDPALGGAASALRRLSLSGGTVLVADALPNRRVTFHDLRLDARREAAGMLTATGTARLLSGTLDLPVRLRARAGGAPATLAVTVELPEIRLAEAAALWPEAPPLPPLDGPLAIAGDATFDAGLAAQTLSLRIGLGAATGVWPVDGATARVGLVPGGIRVEELRVTLAGGAAALRGRGGASLRPDGVWAGDIDVEVPEFDAAQLRAAWPAAMAPAWRDRVVAAAQAGRAGGSARVAFTVDGTSGAPQLLEGSVRATLREARIGLGTGFVPVAAAELGATLAGDTLRLDAATLRLADTPDGISGPTLTATGAGSRAHGLWRGTVEARLDALPVAGLPHWWPTGVQRAERLWLTTNVTAGIARNALWKLSLQSSAATPFALDVTALEGGAEWADATVHWLRPVPPVAGASGTAEFGLTTITVRGSGGRQLDTDGKPTGLTPRDATVRFLELDTRPGRLEMAVDVAGPLTDLVTLLRHPRLKLFEKRPLELRATGGTAQGRIFVGFPLWNELPMDQLVIRANGRVTDGRIADALLGRDVEAGQLGFEVDTEKLAMNGEARLAGLPLRINLAMDFRTGAPTQVIERATVSTTADAAALGRLGFDTGGLLEGSAAIVAEARKQRDGDGRVAIRADLGRAVLALPPLGWRKPSGAPATAEATLRLRGETLVAAEAVRVQAPELLLRGSVGFAPDGKLARAEIAEARLGATHVTGGEATAPGAPGQPWRVFLRGPVLDLQKFLEADSARPSRRDDAKQTPFDIDTRFDRVSTAPDRALLGVAAHVLTGAAGEIREAQLAARTAAGGGAVSASVAPAPGGGRAVKLEAADAGALLRALDLTEALRGGRLAVEAAYASSAPGAPLAGTATLDGFSIRDAPAAGKLLQMMSLYGVIEAMQGDGGLLFSRAIVPFTLTPATLSIHDARAYSASLGLTAKGRLLRETRMLEAEGTIVPSYALNAALGNLPLIGRLFSAEVGGGLFAATWRLAGPLADPSFSVNPLAALTPGFLRGIFGGGASGPATSREEAAQARPLE